MIKPIGLAIGHAVYYLAFSLFFVLRLLWQPLEFLLLPVLYLGEFFLRCFLAPFRFLAKFEVSFPRQCAHQGTAYIKSHRLSTSTWASRL